MKLLEPFVLLTNNCNKKRPYGYDTYLEANEH
jgi:hypothetical protein